MTTSLIAENPLLQTEDSTPTQQPSTHDVVISVHNISKMYPLYARPNDRLKQSLWYALPRFLRGNRPPNFYREFWALNDISFEVKKGEAVGIVGRNGSGKSTLLQIIAGTLAPTSGEVYVNGRVAALLELGSGFNVDFTGRENIYLNAAILGLTQTETDGLYDDIVAFADIGQFIDQPVRLYSSGMVVRLAFAVQALVPKEVLIVDEALAVGDEAFQRKCMRVLEEFQDRGGSILLVSHDAQTINRRCQQAVLLVEGQMLIKDQSKIVTDIYQRMLYGNSQQRQEIVNSLASGASAREIVQTGSLPVDSKSVEKLISRSQQFRTKASYDTDLQQVIEKSYGNGKAEIVDAFLLDEEGNRVNILVSGERYYWCYKVHFNQDAHYVHFGMMLKTIDGVNVCSASTLHEEMDIPFVRKGAIAEVKFSLDLNVSPGTYYFNCGVSAIEVDSFAYLHRRIDVTAIRVVPPDWRTFSGIAYLNHQIQYNIRPGES